VSILAAYRPSDFAQVARFARTLPEFDYLQAVIRVHTELRSPGKCWVWQEAGRVKAVCGMAYLNRDDAWLYGMRVNPKNWGQGIATEFTRELFRVAAKSGRSWVGLDTRNHPTKAPVWRISEKLGMRFEGVQACDIFWNLPARFAPPESERCPGLYDDAQLSGPRLMLEQKHDLWRWYRIIPARRAIIRRHACTIAGVPVHLASAEWGDKGRASEGTIVNLFDATGDLRALFRQLFGLAAGKRRRFVLHYRAEHARRIRAAARAVLPALRPGRNCCFSTWRIYGRRLSA
jgi:RimJ/RimL family protein N-acetyltransferase